MDYLGLTNFFLVETGVTDQVSTTAEAQDDVIQAAHWVNTSWQHFQRNRKWPFREAEGVLNIVAGDTEYVFDGEIMRLGDSVVPHSFYSPLGSVSHVSYKEIRALRRANSPADGSRPTHIAVRDGVFHTHPATAVPVAVDYDYWRAVTAFEEDEDVPYGLPADFHALIAHLAIARYGLLAGGTEGANLFNYHGKEYKTIVNDYLSHVGIGPGTFDAAIRNTLLTR